MSAILLTVTSYCPVHGINGCPVHTESTNESKNQNQNPLHHQHQQRFMDEAMNPQNQPIKNKPLAKHILNNLDEFTLWTDKQARKAGMCVICQYNICVGETATSPACSHSFHSKCIRPWFKEHDTCPTCRAKVSS